MELLGLLIGILTLLAIHSVYNAYARSILFIAMVIIGTVTGFVIWPYSVQLFNILLAVWCIDVLLVLAYQYRQLIFITMEIIFVRSKHAGQFAKIFAQGFGAGIGLGLIWLLAKMLLSS